MRWPGYRKVRRQVCKRVVRRLDELGLADTFAYRTYLETHPDEWRELDELCHIPISRFYRDRAVFEHLGQNVLPHLAETAAARSSDRIRAWSAGCGAGEEPYTLAILWRLSLRRQFPDVTLQILATDVDHTQLARALAACYPYGSLEQLPAAWIEAAFEQRAGRYCLRPEFQAGVEFQQQDIRLQRPQGTFDMVLCRNVVFTYFAQELQLEIAIALHNLLVPGGVLVLGIHEALPPGIAGLQLLEPRLRVYRRDSVSVTAAS
jgi:chemotaxis protein methyltransferase CheR